MIYVLTPVYDYEEYPQLKEFDSMDKALAFIDNDLLQNEHATFKHSPDAYTVIDGKRVKIKAIEYASKVVVDK